MKKKTFESLVLFTFHFADLPCYTTSHYNASINGAKIVWSFVTVTILVATGLIAAAYFIYRKRQKEKFASGIFQNLS